MLVIVFQGEPSPGTMEDRWKVANTATDLEASSRGLALLSTYSPSFIRSPFGFCIGGSSGNSYWLADAGVVQWIFLVSYRSCMTSNCAPTLNFGLNDLKRRVRAPLISFVFVAKKPCAYVGLRPGFCLMFPSRSC